LSNLKSKNFKFLNFNQKFIKVIDWFIGVFNKALLLRQLVLIL
jgi:hypothetical protein